MINIAPHAQSTLKGIYNQDLRAPAWDDHNFLVFMDAVKGTRGPPGYLRLVVQTEYGGRQIADVQCEKLGPLSSSIADKPASTKKAEKDLQLLRDCVQR